MKKFIRICNSFILAAILIINTFSYLTFAESSTTLSTTTQSITTSHKSETQKETETTTVYTTRYETYYSNEQTSTTEVRYTTTQAANVEEDDYDLEEDDEEDEEDQIEYTPYYESTTAYNRNSYAEIIDTSNKTTHSTTTTQTTTTQTTTIATTTEVSSEFLFSSISIPKLLGTGVEISGINTNIVGIAAWGVIAIAVAIVFIIIFRNKRKTSRGTSIGRNRYKRNPSSSKDKRLLSDKYYSSKYKRRP